MATATKTKRTTKSAAPVEDDDEETEAPAPRKRTPAKKAAPAPKKAAAEGKGTAWLKDHVSEKLGRDVESTKLRIVLRKLIKDNVIESPKDGRYQFTGVKDPNVVAVVAALREEAKSGPARRGRKPKATVADEVDDEEEEVEDLDLDDDE